MVKITEVLPGSRGDKAGINAGDILISINGHEINDVLDYRFYLAEKSVELIISRESEIIEKIIKKSVYDDIGLGFATPLMDKKHRCENGCIFCFIDQLPKGMRDSLYFKDDDSRLSFLHGNYITMTNLSEHDIDRIIEMHISPVNISVHTTNPELRRSMMRNKRAGEVLSYLKKLADGGCELHCQIVLCNGINDKAELDRTMNDLIKYYPSLQSVSVVPAGLTAFRGGLYHLEPFSPEECADVINQVESFAEMCRVQFGQRLFFCADEFYVKAGLPLHDDDYYEEYTQIENGIGMLTSFGAEAEAELKNLSDDEKSIKREVSIATGEASYEFICSVVAKITDICYNLKCRVYKIKNEFFGGEVTVSGLVTGADMKKQLSEMELGECLYFSRSMLRSEGDLFLCGMSPDELSEALGVRVVPVENNGSDFVLSILGII